MRKYNIGEIWWTNFPFNDSNNTKHRPAIIIDEDRIAILTMYVTSKNKENPFSVEITDWKNAGLAVPSWARIDRIISIDEWRINQKIGKLTNRDLLKFMQLISEFSTSEFHEFSLIALIHSDGRFLQVFDKRWNLYTVLLKDIPKNMQSKEFELDGRQYKWMSITDMENDSEIMDKNDDVIAFVKTKCDC